VLQKIAAPGLFLVDHDHVMGVLDSQFCEVFPDATEPYDDDVHEYRLPPPALK
jgi:hypothetical protein